MRRPLRSILVSAGIVVALAVLLALPPLYPQLLAPLALVWALAQVTPVPAKLARNRRYQAFNREMRAHATAAQAIRGFMVAAAALDIAATLGVASVIFYAMLVLAVAFMPRLVNRLAPVRSLVQGLPGPQEVQDRMDLFNTVSSPGRLLRAQFMLWTTRLEVVVTATVTATAYGASENVGRWIVIVAIGLATLTALVEALTFIKSSALSTGKNFHEQVVQALADYAPEYIVHFSAGASAVYQIRQWLPHLMAMPRRFAVLTRETGLVPRVAELAPGVPVIATTRLANLDSLVVDSIRVVLYVNNGMKNAHMLRHTHLRHVQMLHGESDKSPSVNKFARAYDQLYVAGQAAIDRYGAYGVTVDPRAFRVVGRPQADEVRTDVPPGRPTVLYAPTWEGFRGAKSESSVGVLGVELVRNLLARGDVRVIVRPHPTTGIVTPRLLNDVAAMRTLVEQAGGDHMWSAADGDLSLVDCFNLCTVMIADISSVMADFLRSEKGLIVTDADDLGTEGLRDSFPTASAAWILQRDGGNIDEILVDALGPDSLRAARTRTRHYVLGDFDGPAEPVFHRVLAASIDDPLHDMPEGADDVSEGDDDEVD